MCSRSTPNEHSNNYTDFFRQQIRGIVVKAQIEEAYIRNVSSFLSFLYPIVRKHKVSS